MGLKNKILLLGMIAVIEYSLAAPTTENPMPTATVLEAQENLESVVRDETEKFLNNLFKSQIEFFQKVKVQLPAGTQRVQAIEQYIERLQEAIQKQKLTDKDEAWIDTFKKFNKSPLLLNNEEETKVTDEEYEKIITENGLNELVKNVLADLAVYFWKMAKASGKVVEVTVDEYLEKLKNDVSSRKGLMVF